MSDNFCVGQRSEKRRAVLPGLPHDVLDLIQRHHEVGHARGDDTRGGGGGEPGVVGDAVEGLGGERGCEQNNTSVKLPIHDNKKKQLTG